MHKSLLTTEIFVCEGMWTELVLPEEDNSVTVRSDRAVVDIRHIDGNLAIYVPSDLDGLYSCFHTEMPGELANLLGIENQVAGKAIYRILNDNEKDLDVIMRDEDIPEYPWFDKPPRSQQAIAISAVDDMELLSGRSASISTSDTDATSPTDADATLLPDAGNDVMVLQTDQGSTAAQSRALNSFPSPVHVQSTGHHPVWEAVARDEQYKRLLKEVIRQAKRDVPFRGRASLSLHEIDEALDDLDHPADYAAFHRTFGNTGFGKFDENARVGAAGELFVSSESRITHEQQLT